MRRHPQGLTAAALIGWVAWCLLSGPAPASAATEPLSGAGPSGRPVEQFDRAALQTELSRPTASLRAQPTEALRTHVQRLADLHFALELAVDVSPAERRVLSEQILARVGQVGLLIRQRAAEPHAPGRGRGAQAGEAGPPPTGSLASVILENSGLLVRLLAGLLIAFALGSLAGYRRAARMSSSGVQPDAAIPPQVQLDPSGEAADISLPGIREALAAGRTVLLQMGYEVAPARRRRYLELLREVQEILRRVEGQTHTVWEDLAHPHRFYELLACRRVEILDQLAATDGPLATLAEEIEACRVPDGFTLRRAWWGALPGQEGTARVAPLPIR